MLTETKLESLEVSSKTGALRVDAKCAYRDGKAILSVYGFIKLDRHTPRGAPLTRKHLLLRAFVDRDTPIYEKREQLQAMCDLVAVHFGCEVIKRSKHIR